jgi:hypothetical protein
VADPDDLKRLEQGITEWNEWRRVTYLYPDLSDADLSGANLSGADLSYTNLSRAELCKANLRGVVPDRTNNTIRPRWDAHVGVETGRKIGKEIQTS